MNKPLTVAFAVSIAVLLAGLPARGGETGAGDGARRLPLMDGSPESLSVYHGEPVSITEAVRDKVAVLRFWSPSCPHAQSLDPAMADLASSFKDRIAVFDVDSNWKSNPEDSERIREERGLGWPMIRDPRSLLARALKARTNGEFFVFRNDGTLAYRGTNDIARYRPAMKIADVHHLVEKLLAGDSVECGDAPCFGCYINYNPIVHKEDLDFLKKIAVLDE
ncbi:MAG: redoxin domain-containing protein [bacterium]|nr:redoxin domain-containing protein [bacterium]